MLKICLATNEFKILKIKFCIHSSPLTDPSSLCTLDHFCPRFFEIASVLFWFCLQTRFHCGPSWLQTCCSFVSDSNYYNYRHTPPCPKSHLQDLLPLFRKNSKTPLRPTINLWTTIHSIHHYPMGNHPWYPPLNCGPPSMASTINLWTTIHGIHH